MLCHQIHRLTVERVSTPKHIHWMRRVEPKHTENGAVIFGHSISVLVAAKPWVPKECMQIYAYRVTTRITGSHDFIAASHSHNRWAVFLFIDEKRFAKYFIPTHMPRTYEPWIIQLYTHARQTQTKFKHSNVWVQRHHACPPPAVAAHRWTTSTEIICLSVLVAPYVVAAHPFFRVCVTGTHALMICALYLFNPYPPSLGEPTVFDLPYYHNITAPANMLCEMENRIPAMLCCYYVNGRWAHTHAVLESEEGAKCWPGLYARAFSMCALLTCNIFLHVLRRGWCAGFPLRRAWASRS